MVRPPGHDSVTMPLVQEKAVNWEYVSGSGSDEDVTFCVTLFTLSFRRELSCSKAPILFVKRSPRSFSRWLSFVKTLTSCCRTRFSFSTSPSRIKTDFSVSSRSLEVSTSVWNITHYEPIAPKYVLCLRAINMMWYFCVFSMLLCQYYISFNERLIWPSLITPLRCQANMLGTITCVLLADVWIKQLKNVLPLLPPPCSGKPTNDKTSAGRSS